MNTHVALPAHKFIKLHLKEGRYFDPMIPYAIITRDVQEIEHINTDIQYH